MIFGAFFVHFPAVFATAFAVVRPIKPDCYHCLRIHIFVWKKCTTVDKRHIAPQGDPVACGHWKIFMCILDIFQPQFSTYFAVNNSDRGQWQGRQGNMLGGNLFLVFGI